MAMHRSLSPMREKMPIAINNITEERFESYYTHPGGFCEDWLGIKTWSGMRMIMDSVFTNQRTSVRACHGLSKTITAAAIAVTFLNLFDQSVVITTAPTNRLVQKLLWKEIRGIYSRVKLAGRCLEAEIKVAPEWYMIGFSTDNASGLEGFHAPCILWILDEAKGLPKWLYTSMEGSFTGGFSRALEISTTDGADQSSEFRRHHEKDRVRWNPIHFSAMDSPFIAVEDFPEHKNRLNTKLYEYGKPKTGTEWPLELAGKIQITDKNWLVDRLEDWGERDPQMVETKVWGEFSAEDTDNVIPLAWVEAAVNAEVTVKRYDRRMWGIDVARMGPDKTVIMSKTGRRVEVVDSWRKKRTTETAGKVINMIPANELIKIDADGLGVGVYDMIADAGRPIIGLQSSAKAYEADTYFNLRAEMWWNARELFYEQFKYGDKLSIPDDPELIEDLTGIKYQVNKDGRYQIEDKNQYKKRLERSPDKGDTLVYTLYDPPIGDIEGEYGGEVEREEEGVVLP